MIVTNSSPVSVRRWLIGSQPECDLVVNLPAVSGRHCVLSQDASGFTLEDLGSTNGTFVNEQRIAPHQLVRVNRQDKITLGRNAAMPWPPETPANDSGARRSGRTLVQESTRVITIGRAPTNTQVLDFPMISWEHARITEDASGRLFIEDLGSTNGTAVNTIENKIKSQQIQPTDDILLGSYRVPVSRLLTSKHMHLGFGAAAEPLDFRGDIMVIGRDPQADYHLDNPLVSWRHARVTRAADGIQVEDLGSRNGTFVNGARISGKVKLQPGQELALGHVRLVLLDAGGKLARKDYTGNFAIEANQVIVQIADGRRLLNPVSFSVYPQELVALMGPAGAGKTTLLKALNGYTPLGPSNGRVLFNNADLNTFYDSFRLIMGYVPQDDIMHAQLTVREALYFTARLRTDMKDAEIQARIEKVLRELDILDIVDREIGSPEKKVLSGGQRKRVNVAMELLSDPDVLFLDEPTSGLSSYDAEQVIKLLRRLADSGKTIITTIHQPSLDIYKQFDNLLMMARDKGNKPGELAYYGPAYPQSIEFLHPQGTKEARAAGRDPGPELLLSGLATNTSTHWAEKYDKSQYKKQYVTDRAGQAPPGAQAKGPAKATRLFNLVQLIPLIHRNIVLKTRDKVQTALMLIQAPFFAFLLSIAFHGNDAAAFTNAVDWTRFSGRIGSTYFLMVVAVIWFGCNNAARDIVGEWAVYTRERMVNLKIPSYVFSKLCVLGVMCLIQCTVLLAIVYPATGLKGPLLQILGVLFLASMVGSTLGLLISAFAKSTEAAIMLLPIVLLPMIVLGGGIKPIHEMNTVVQAASTIIPSRWAFEASFGLEAAERPETYTRRDCEAALDSQRNACNQQLSRVPGARQLPPATFAKSNEDVAETAFPKDKRYSLGDSVSALGGMFLVLLSGVFISLRRRDIR